MTADPLASALSDIVRAAVREAMAERTAVEERVPSWKLALTIDEAAALVGVTGRTIDRWIKAGTLPVVRQGGIVRIRRAALDEWLRARETGGMSWQPTVVDDVFRPRKG